MTPAEHYAEAERLALLAVHPPTREDDEIGPVDDDVVALAQVHATLAASAPHFGLAVPTRADIERRDAVKKVLDTDRARAAMSAQQPLGWLVADVIAAATGGQPA